MGCGNSNCNDNHHPDCFYFENSDRFWKCLWKFLFRRSFSERVFWMESPIDLMCLWSWNFQQSLLWLRINQLWWISRLFLGITWCLSLSRRLNLGFWLFLMQKLNLSNQICMGRIKAIMLPGLWIFIYPAIYSFRRREFFLYMLE